MTARGWLTRSGFAAHLLALAAKAGRLLWRHAPGKLRMLGIMLVLTGSQWYGLIDIFGLPEAKRIAREVKQLQRRQKHGRGKEV